MRPRATTFAIVSGPSIIRRKDLQREVRVSTSPDGRALGDIMAEIEAAAAGIQLPPGYDILSRGDAEELKDMFGIEFWQEFFGLKELTTLDLGRRVKLATLIAVCRIFGLSPWV